MTHRSEHFLDFIRSLEGVLKHYGKNDTAYQRGQVEGLMAAERDFRRALIHHCHGRDVYQAFIHYVMVERHNILMARPYFRERDVTFKAFISGALRSGSFRKLYRFDINFQFIQFALRCRQWGNDPASKRLLRLGKEVYKRREALIECNLPLVISQARMFFGRNRASHHTYMDFLQVAAGGLAAGVDKYVGAYTTGFRAVLIGRILGDLIECNSETFVHFFPADKRRLYRIRKIAAAMREGVNNADYVLLTKALNKKEREEGESLTKSGELYHLVNASSLVSASTLPLGEDEEPGAGSPIERYPDDAENRPDVLLEERQARHTVAGAITTLSVVDRKLLRLRGVDLSMMGG